MIQTLLTTVSLGLIVCLSSYPTVLLIAMCLLLFIIDRIHPNPFLFYVICGFGGAIAESVAILYGSSTWTYKEPMKPLVVPLWLVPLWSIAAVFIINVHAYLTRGLLRIDLLK
jgi:hypothetical protein